MGKQFSIIKEKQVGEKRVVLLPKDLHIFRQANYEILVEQGAGHNIGIQDYDYENVGAKIVSTAEAWERSQLIFKYKAPIKEEFAYLNDSKTIGAVFHAEGDFELMNALCKSGCTAYSYEFFKTEEGVFPLSVASSEIAGLVAIIYGAYHLQNQSGGRGVLLAPVINANPASVLVIGHGNSGGAAARLASKMGGNVTVLGRNQENLRKFQASIQGNVKCLMNTPETLIAEIKKADLVIGAILISTYDTEVMISEKMVKSMKKGSIIIDVTAGYGPGYIETFNQNTTFSNPIFEKHGVLHCKIDILPQAYSITTVEAMSSHLAPYLLNFAEAYYKKISNKTAEAGKIVSLGELIHPELIRHYKHYQVNNERSSV